MKIIITKTEVDTLCSEFGFDNTKKTFDVKLKAFQARQTISGHVEIDINSEFLKKVMRIVKSVSVMFKEVFDGWFDPIEPADCEEKNVTENFKRTISSLDKNMDSENKE